MGRLSSGVVLYDASGNAVSIINDSGIYRVSGISKVLNSSGSQIDPATQGTLSDVDTKLGTIDSVLDSIKDTDGIKKITDALPAGTNNIGDVDVASSALPTGAATESTLSSADTKLGTIDSVLDSIKDTDGVKKITDALPAGTNLLGKVQLRNPGNSADLGDASNPVRTDTTGTTTQPISAASLPLPTGAATEATLGGVKTNQESVLDTGNSSVAQLGNGGTFVGTGVDCIGYSAVSITVHSDEDSATDGMVFEFSMDNSNWDDSYPWTLDASESETRRFQFPVTARYFRVNYTNGNQTTTEFRCQTILHRQNILTSIHRLKSNASDDRSAAVVKSAIIAQRTGGPTQEFIAVEADPGGNLKVALGVSIPEGTNNIGDVDVVSSALPAGAATETTLAAADTKLGTIDGVLDSIKDTDGIKKITDALPVGDNNIGRVKITDGTNVAAVVTDNSINRLESRTTIVGQTAGTGSEKKASVIDDVEDSNVKRLQTQALLAPGSTVNIGTSIPADPASLTISFLEQSGGGHTILVDGSTTPVELFYQPAAGKTVAVDSVLIVFAADDFEFDGLSFGPNTALTTGCEFKLTVDSSTTTIFTIQRNEDFLRIPGRVPVINNTGPKDLLSAAFSFGGLVKLHGDDNDRVSIVVNDNLTSTKLKYFTATIYGAEV